jgi:hypothetical protein
MFRQADVLTAMPTGPIEHHHYPFFQVTRSDFINEDLNAVAIDMRQNQAVQAPIQRRHCRIGVSVFLLEHCPHQRAQWLGTPATAHCGNMTRAHFILKHHPHRCGARHLGCGDGNLLRQGVFSTPAVPGHQPWDAHRSVPPCASHAGAASYTRRPTPLVGPDALARLA